MTENHNVRRAQREAKKIRGKASRKLDAQMKVALTRAKYGPAGRPGKVTVRRLDTGAVVDVVDQSRVKSAGKRDRSIGEAARRAVGDR